jgi:hypothetical protein
MFSQQIVTLLLHVTATSLREGEIGRDDCLLQVSNIQRRTAKSILPSCVIESVERRTEWKRGHRSLRGFGERNCHSKS